MLTWSDINTADSLLLTFCKKVSELYGSDCHTPNMHLHLHLKETLQDFGPAHATWCFSFERFNGILGSMPTNKKMRWDSVFAYLFKEASSFVTNYNNSGRGFQESFASIIVCQKYKYRYNTMCKWEWSTGSFEVTPWAVGIISIQLQW